MARLPFGRCRPKPGEPCPLCHKPVRVMRARSLVTAFQERDWIVCSGAPHCAYARLERRRAYDATLTAADSSSE
jgi:hypothetical protein